MTTCRSNNLRKLRRIGLGWFDWVFLGADCSGYNVGLGWIRLSMMQKTIFTECNGKESDEGSFHTEL